MDAVVDHCTLISFFFYPSRNGEATALPGPMVVTTLSDRKHLQVGVARHRLGALESLQWPNKSLGA